MPFAVIGSEKDVKTHDGRVLKGRQYSWGVAEVENEDHCDFKKLRSILIRTHMLDLIHTTEEVHYEQYRAQQMETRKFGEARPRKLDNPKFKEEEESLRRRFTEQVKVEENRFRTWEQKLISERDRLNKDLESTHAAYVPLQLLLPRKFPLTKSQHKATGDGIGADARNRWPAKPRTSLRSIGILSEGEGEACSRTQGGPVSAAWFLRTFPMRTVLLSYMPFSECITPDQLCSSP